MASASSSDAEGLLCDIPLFTFPGIDYTFNMDHQRRLNVKKYFLLARTSNVLLEKDSTNAINRRQIRHNKRL